MKTVLTIDFDIIMGPSIDIYNKNVPEKSWMELKKNPYYNILSLNGDTYYKLTNLLKIMFSHLSKDNIYFIADHSFIVPNINEKINLINIDHHHDLGYKDEINNDDNYGCATWVKYLKNKNLIENYTWLKNNNSEMPNDFSLELLIDECNNITEYDLTNMPVPDEIYICFSPEWIPPEYHPLYFLWIDMANRDYLENFSIQWEKD